MTFMESLFLVLLSIPVSVLFVYYIYCWKKFLTNTLGSDDETFFISTNVLLIIVVLSYISHRLTQ